MEFVCQFSLFHNAEFNILSREVCTVAFLYEMAISIVRDTAYRVSWASVLFCACFHSVIKYIAKFSSHNIDEENQ